MTKTSSAEVWWHFSLQTQLRFTDSLSVVREGPWHNHNKTVESILKCENVGQTKSESIDH